MKSDWISAVIALSAVGCWSSSSDGVEASADGSSDVSDSAGPGDGVDAGDGPSDLPGDGLADADGDADGFPMCDIEWTQRQFVSHARPRALAVAMSETTVIYAGDTHGLVRMDRSTGSPMWSVGVRPDARNWEAAIVWTGTRFLGAVEMQRGLGEDDGLWSFVLGDGDSESATATSIAPDGHHPALALSPDGSSAILAYWNPSSGAYIVELDAATGVPRDAAVHVDSIVARYGMGVGRRPAGGYWLARLRDLSSVEEGTLRRYRVDGFDQFVHSLSSDRGIIAAVVIVDGADTLLLWDSEGRAMADPGIGPVYEIAAWDRFVLTMGAPPIRGHILDETGAASAAVELTDPGRIGAGPGGFVHVSSPAEYYDNPTIAILEPICITEAD